MYIVEICVWDLFSVYAEHEIHVLDNPRRADTVDKRLYLGRRVQLDTLVCQYYVFPRKPLGPIILCECLTLDDGFYAEYRQYY